MTSTPTSGNEALFPNPPSISALEAVMRSEMSWCALMTSQRFITASRGADQWTRPPAENVLLAAASIAPENSRLGGSEALLKAAVGGFWT